MGCKNTGEGEGLVKERREGRLGRNSGNRAGLTEQIQDAHSCREGKISLVRSTGQQNDGKRAEDTRKS